jgi:hypothetical protein
MSIGHVTKLDSFTFIQVGFIATLGALLPPLMRSSNWRRRRPGGHQARCSRCS